jgi:hypothetical protein
MTTASAIVDVKAKVCNRHQYILIGFLIVPVNWSPDVFRETRSIRIGPTRVRD